MPGLTIRWVPALLAGLTIGLGAAIHAGALTNPFVYDDRVTILENPSIRRLDDLGAVLRHTPFRPLVNLFYALDYAGWGLDPFGYHLTSLLLHLVNVGLVFSLAYGWAHDAGGVKELGVRPRRLMPAFGTGALFAVHPVLTEAVGYVSGRSEVLCGTFFLASLLAWRRGLRTGGAGSIAVAVAFWGLALLSKETAAVLPLVLLVGDGLGLWGEPRTRARRIALFYLPLLAVVAVAGGLRLATFFAVETSARVLPWWQYGLTQAIVIWRYVELLVLPVGQSIVHPVEPVAGPFDPRAWGAVAALVGAVGVGVMIRRRAPLVTFGTLWFLLLLVPSSSVIALLEPTAEHRVYLARVGFFLAVTAGLAQASALATARGRFVARAAPSLGWGLLVLVLGVLGSLTVARTAVWSDPVRLWQDAARKAPRTWAPQYALGDALREQGGCQEAIGAYEAAIRLLPTEPAAHTNLGICLAQLDRYADAYRAFTEAARLDPRRPGVRLNLGLAAVLAGDAEAGRHHLLAALAEDPRSIEARVQLAQLYETVLPNPEEALRLCREIHQLAPDTPGIQACMERNRALRPQPS